MLRKALAVFWSVASVLPFGSIDTMRLSVLQTGPFRDKTIFLGNRYEDGGACSSTAMPMTGSSVTNTW